MSYFFTKSIVLWSDKKIRKLPWKPTDNPYFIWIREVVLQQTRVEQGYIYYERLISEYPDIFSLARADLTSVYKNWEGLGYYSRAKNLHETAQFIVNRYQGAFPENYNEILKLKGIGEYTAAAIMSFAYHQPYAVLDGNVFRVLSRFFNIDTPMDTAEGKKLFKSLAQKLLDKDQAAKYNQAILDLGAVICKPKQPLCNQCPLATECKAFELSRTEALPIKANKIKKLTRYFNFIVIAVEDSIFIEQRDAKDIWRHLYQFPLVESEKKLLKEIEMPLLDLSKAESVWVSKVYRQTLTHRIIKARFFEYKMEYVDLPETFLKIKNYQLKEYGFPKIIREYLSDRYNYIN